MDKVLEIVSSVVKKDVAFLKENATEDTVWNSLSKVEILMILEEEYDILFDQDDIKHIRTLKDLMDVMGEKI